MTAVRVSALVCAGVLLVVVPPGRVLGQPGGGGSGGGTGSSDLTDLCDESGGSADYSEVLRCSRRFFVRTIGRAFVRAVKSVRRTH